MGNKNSPVQTLPTDADARQAAALLLAPQETLAFPHISPHLALILKKIKIEWPFKNTRVCVPILHIYLHPFYRDFMLKAYRLLVASLQGILSKTTLMIVSRDSWRACDELAQFIIIFTDEKLRRLVNSLPQKIRKGEVSEDASIQLDGDNPEVPYIFGSLSPEQKRENIRVFTDTLHDSLKLKENPIGRSAYSYHIIYSLCQSLFSFNLHLLLDTDPEDRQTRDAFLSVDNFKKHLTICTYVVGYSLELNVASTLEMAILMLDQLIDSFSEEIPYTPQIPSHAFNKLPIMTCSNAFEQIITLLLYGLSQLVQVGEGEAKGLAHKYKFSRIKAMRLATKMIKKCKPTNKECTYYIQILCKTIGIMNIEKYCLFILVHTYSTATGKTTSLIDKYLKARTTSSQVEQLHEDSTTQANQPSVNLFQGVDPFKVDEELGKIMGDPHLEYEAYNEKMIYEKLCHADLGSDATQKIIWPLIEPRISSQRQSRDKEIIIEELDKVEEQDNEQGHQIKVRSSLQKQGLYEQELHQIE